MPEEGVESSRDYVPALIKSSLPNGPKSQEQIKFVFFWLVHIVGCSLKDFFG